MICYMQIESLRNWDKVGTANAALFSAFRSSVTDVKSQLFSP